MNQSLIHSLLPSTPKSLTVLNVDLRLIPTALMRVIRGEVEEQRRHFGHVPQQFQFRTPVATHSSRHSSGDPLDGLPGTVTTTPAPAAATRNNRISALKLGRD